MTKPRPPQSTEETKQWIDSHTEAGKINGEPVLLDGRAEFRYGYVPGELYDHALLMAAPFSFTKSEIAAHGASRLLSNAVINGASSGLIAPVDYKEGTEFRAFLPTGLYNLIQERKKELNWSNSQMMVMILVYFAHDPGVQKIYQSWSQGLAMKLGCTVPDIEKAVYDRCRYLARVKRYEMSIQRGEFVSDRKIAT